MILEYLKAADVSRYEPHICHSIPERPSYSSVDWLRCTNPRISEFDSFVKKFLPFFRYVGLTFADTGRGMNGYTNSWAIKYDEQVVGHICADALDRMGGMIEFTGLGCQLLQARWDFWYFMLHGLKTGGFRITRLDVCSDFKGALWSSYGFNMINFAEGVKNGMFTIGNGRGRKPSVVLVGDWLDVVVDRMSGAEYSPHLDCSGGLTINVGSTMSVNSFCIYEKGKQLAGKNPELFDFSLNSWVRVERRFARGSGRSEVVIPFDFACFPDKALVFNCEGLKDFINEWLDYQLKNGVDVGSGSADDDGVDVERVGLLKTLSVKKTALHVARQSARFFKTLELSGINVLDFYNLVKHNQASKSYNPLYCSGYDIMTFLKEHYKNENSSEIIC